MQAHACGMEQKDCSHRKFNITSSLLVLACWEGLSGKEHCSFISLVSGKQGRVAERQQKRPCVPSCVPSQPYSPHQDRRRVVRGCPLPSMWDAAR